MPETILVVDDEPANLALLSGVLSEQYRVRAVRSGVRALQAAGSEPMPDLVLLDLMMPEIDGYEVLSGLKANPRTRDIPVIFVTAAEAAADEARGLTLGAVDYITKPFQPAILLARVRTHLVLREARALLHRKNEVLEAEVERRLRENQLIQDVSIHALAFLAETRDPETGDHILRTQRYVERLARALQGHPRFRDTISEDYIRLLTQSAPLHDIGKVGIPDEILLKPGRLTAQEWAIMQTHAALGARAIERAERAVDHPVEFLRLAREIAHWHHERWDGGGYPDGLAGEAIPVSARLMAVADVFDAMISPRVYKPAMAFPEARDRIAAERDRQFDAAVVDAFVADYEEWVAIARRHGGA